LADSSDEAAACVAAAAGSCALTADGAADTTAKSPASASHLALMGRTVDRSDRIGRVSDQWVQVDDYITTSVVRPDEALERAVAATKEAGMPPIAVSAPYGKMLHLFARMIGARRILEIGTLGGYSTIWLARALPPDGQVVTLELSEKHAHVARANLAAAGLENRVTIRVGPALETLAKLDTEGKGNFDLTFVDADKGNLPKYLEWAVKLSHPGGVIVVDNAVREGRLVGSPSTDPNIEGTRQMHQLLSRTDSLSATTIQTVGTKGYDGFTLAIID
jgi:predicted O-methyltransferase YrrM